MGKKTRKPRKNEEEVFYEKIHDLRVDKDLSKKKMSEHLGCKRKMYGKYERYGNIPSDILIQLAYFHNVSVDYLLGRTEEPTPHFN